MAAERWSNDGTECISLRLVRSTQGDESTCPILFCYPLFGEAQVIYGYENLDIQLAFASGSLASYLSVTYDAKMPSTSSVKPDDVEGTFYKWLPADYLKDEAAFDARVEQDTREFRPYGQRIASYARRVVAPAAATNGKGKGKATVTDDSDDHDEGDEPREQWEDCAADAEGAIVYEVWHATMATPGFRTYLRRMQIFVPLYIEGGEYIDEEDDRWEFVILYERRPRDGDAFTYHFIGFSNLYPYLFWPSSTRMRLAQFIILPPFQGAGHGSRFYSTIYLWLLSRSEIAELTVEDPSEAFQDMRDKADLGALVSRDVMKGIAAPVDREWARKLQREMKLADRQFARLIEMALLLQMDPRDKAQAKAFRLAVKERLFRFNHDVLVSVEKEERRELLKTTFDGLMEDYDRLTAAFRPANGVAKRG